MRRIEMENPMVVDSYWPSEPESYWEHAEIDSREDYLLATGHARAMVEEYMEAATAEDWECLYMALAKFKKDAILHQYIMAHDTELADGYDDWYEEEQK